MALSSGNKEGAEHRGEAEERERSNHDCTERTTAVRTERGHKVDGEGQGDVKTVVSEDRLDNRRCRAGGAWWWLKKTQGALWPLYYNSL